MTEGEATSAASGAIARTTAVAAAIFFLFVVGLLLVWHGATALLLIFAGIVLAVALDAVAGALGRLVGLGRRLRLLAVLLLLLLSLAAGLLWGGAVLAEQFGGFLATVDEQVGGLLDRLARLGIRPGDGGGSDGMGGLAPSVGGLLGGATQALFGLFGAVGNLVLVIFLGAFFAWEPRPYVAGLLSLLPRRHRRRVAAVLGDAAACMRGWLTGQAISMAVIFALTYVLLLAVGMPSALLLALLAGLLEFVSTIGPLLAGVAIVLAGFAEGAEMALWGAGVYLLIQLVESNLVNPLVQERTARLPPAFTLSVQVLMGALFGFLGLALAVPLAAAARVIVKELYVDDALGGPWPEGAAAPQDGRAPPP